MMHMKVSVRKFKSGERYVFLLQNDGVPDFWVTHFVTQKLRKDHTSTSIQQYLKSLKYLKLWESINKRNILDEIYEGKILTRGDIRSIKEHCTFHSKVFKVEKSASNVIDMGKFYSKEVQEKPTISRSQYISRIAHVAEFLHFSGQERIKKKPNASKLFDEIDEMKVLLKKDMPKGGLRNRPLDKTGITDDAFEDFVEVSKPNSKYNPFKDSLIKFRNYLIVQTLYETGLRCSELLALRISDIGTDINNPTLDVIRRHDSKDDPRLREPTAKTLERRVPISQDLRDLLNKYISTGRIKTSAAHTHPFIFVSHKEKAGSYQSGQPIIQQTVNKLFDSIKGVNPERFWGISPHSFRHYFNDQLSKRIDEHKKFVTKEVKRLESEGRTEEAKQYAHENMITQQRELEIRAELNGHSSLESGQAYLKRTVKEQAKNIRQMMHEKLKNKAEY
jgi:integrase